MNPIHALAVAGAIIIGSAWAPALADPAGVTRRELQRHDLGAPRQEVVQVAVTLAKGALAPNHTHPGEEVIYVLQGQIKYEVEGRPPVALKAGNVLLVPAGVVHSARNVGGGKAVELSTYIVEKGKPLTTPAK